MTPTILGRATRGGAALLAFAFLCLAPTRASAQTPVVFGDTITDPGLYFLAGNQTGGGNGIRIESDDVVLLLGRFTLRGDGTGAGIASDGNDNVQIYGGRVTNFEFGIGFVDADHCTVQGTRIDNNRLVGLSLFNVSDSYFARLSCDHNGGNGVEALGAHDCRFVSILAHDNALTGILLGPSIKQTGTLVGPSDPNSEGNKIRLCWAAYNDQDGIKLVSANDNEIERNQCVANKYAGIRLASSFVVPVLAPAPGSLDNFLRSNWCVFNHDGIRVESTSKSNTLTNNTALASSGHDMIDDNPEPPCENTWFVNFFFSKDGAGRDCIF